MKKDCVWIFTFEYAGIAKVGGLGEVPANQAKNLIESFDICVFTPSHGQIERLKGITDVEKLPFSAVGQINLSHLGFLESENSYQIGYYRCELNRVPIILITGENEFTSKYLDDKSVYNPETINGKLCLFSIAMRCYVEYLIDNQRDSLPDIIHMHDYHVVIPFINTKQELIKNGLDVASIITIHLLTWPRFDLDFYKACGIDNTPIPILLQGGVEKKTFEDIFALCEDWRGPDEDYHPPTVEKIGAVISDLVTTVSESYLNSDIIPNLGQALIKFKSDFVWNGCDWEFDEIYQKVYNTYEPKIRKLLGISDEKEITREDMRDYLLTHKISHLSQSPLISSTKVLNAINEISNGNPFIKNGNIKAFAESGPLILTTGRISRQKGFDTFLEAIPNVVKEIPNARFLLLILPTDYHLEEISSYAEYVKKYPENVRIIFGVAADIFHLAHIAADVYCALSRWEPFGIIALEAMAVKLPIIATKVGGLQESIIDIKENPEYGTGLLIEKDNVPQFVSSLISFLKLIQIKKRVAISGSLYELDTLNMVNSIPDGVIKSRVLLDANYIDKIRENSLNRVKYNFRWNIVSKKLVELYKKVKDIHPKV